ncbi:MAG: sialidase family protein [Saprospiraceae bacterium]
MATYLFIFFHFIQSLLFAHSEPLAEKPTATKIVYRSSDGGHTWLDVSIGLPKDVAFNTVIATDKEIILGSDRGLYIGHTTCSAILWQEDLGLGKSISNLSNGWAGLYVTSYGNGIFQKLIGTEIWVPMDKTLEDKMVRTILEIPGGSVLVATDNGIYKSIDGRKTWKQVFSEGMILNMFYSDGVIIAGGFKGLLRSVDNGENWVWAFTGDGMGLSAGTINGHMVAITSGMGPWGKENLAPFGIKTNRIRTSDDGGQTWIRADAGLSGALLNPELLRKNMRNGVQFRPSAINDIEQQGNYIFCSLDAGVYRSSDLGKTWELVLSSGGNSSFELVVSGGVIYAVSVFSGC